MAEQEDKTGFAITVHIPGVKELGEASVKMIVASVDGVRTFLNALCMPAVTGLGLIASDTVASWREINQVKIGLKTQRLLEAIPGGDTLHAHPRLVFTTIQEGGLTDDETLQDAWAGLLASACTPDGRDDFALIYMNQLKQLTGMEARLLKLACETASHRNEQYSGYGMLGRNHSTSTIYQLAATEDASKVLAALRHLVQMDLLNRASTWTGNGYALVPSLGGMTLHNACRGPSAPGLPLGEIIEWLSSTPEEKGAWVCEAVTITHTF